MHPLEEILHPQSVAVVGASDNPDSWGFGYTRHLLDYGFRGRIYLVNRNSRQVLGMKTYPSLRDIPDSVDYVISVIPASGILNLLEECAQKGVRVVQMFTGHFSETGRREAAELEQEILKQARRKGLRLIGPNCMGVYYPLVGLSFGYNLPKESGTVGMISQTGGGAGIFITSVSMRGVRFSKVISYGNAVDLNECDFLDYFTWDPETKIILMYIEGAKDGQRFLSSLRRATAAKPVVILKGGWGEAGVRTVSSHTAAVAGSMKTWAAGVAQAGAILARDFDELADIAVSLCFLPPIRGSRVGVIGGSGGTCVMAAEECEEAGLRVIDLPPEIREQLKNMGISVWDWVSNPVDGGVMVGSGLTDLQMLELMVKNENFDLLIADLNEGQIVTQFTDERINLQLNHKIKNLIKIKKEGSKPLLAVVGERSLGRDDHDSWIWKSLSEARTKLIQANIPVYPTVRRAVRAVSKLIDYYRRCEL